MLGSMVPRREGFPATFPGFGNEMENLMTRFFGNGHEKWGLDRFTPSVNVSETEAAFEVSAELPGLEAEEVNVEWKEGRLWISGEKMEESEEKEKTFHKIERRHGEFRRMIELPTAIDESKVEAKFEKGVLTIHIPKSEEVKPTKIPIKE